MVTKGVVLLGVQHFQQSARGVTAEVSAQLVNFVEQEQRVLGADLVQVLQHLARQSANVGATVPTDLGFVTHAPQGHAHVLAPGGLGNGLTQ